MQAYYSTILDGPFGKQQVVTKAEGPDQAKLLTQVFDGRQVGHYSARLGMYSPIVEQPRRVAKKATMGMARHNDPYNEIWVKAL